ncbi:MAG TPA: small ribosomal subunit Rsm22 family protein [Candidatus Kapabacteria bacterium]|nr:small ribosomal subunit Rsm22 family protein [Candidatus Kapabacteria bacterium]
MSIKRKNLALAPEYIGTLEEVLGISLDPDSIKRSIIRKRIEGIAEAVRTLSMGLTTGREDFLSEKYLANPAFREAYQLYYTSTNTLKILPQLRELAISNFFKTDSLRVLDLGTGTGASLWGLLQYCQYELSSPPNIEIIAGDNIAENLKFVQRFYSSFSKKLRNDRSTLETKMVDLELADSVQFDSKKFDLVFMTNTLNELSSEAETRLLNLFKSILTDTGFIIITEPAARERSRRLLGFRDAVVKDGFTIFAPCTRQSNCPALTSIDNWCHSEYKWQRPEFVKLIDDAASTLRLSLKSTYMTFNRSGKRLSDGLSTESGLFRIVSERFDEKGRVRAMACGESGRGEYVLNKRSKSENNKAFTDTERYDLVQITGITHREHDNSLSEASKVSIMLQNTGAR